MKFGYARVSTEEQSLDRQIDALNSYGVDELLTEKMTGTKRNRPELDRLLDKLRNRCYRKPVSVRTFHKGLARTGRAF